MAHTRQSAHAPAGGQGSGARQDGIVADVKQDAAALEHKVNPEISTIGGFWTKINNDWIMNLAGLLAYNFLMSIFPILLALLAIGGLILNMLSPSSYNALVSQMSSALPGGGTIINVVTKELARNGGLVFIIGVVMAVITGSRLFITIENCFGIVFRLRSRNVIRQNLMAIGMLLIYVVLIPFVFLASIVPTVINRTLQVGPLGGLIDYIIGVVVGFLVGALLFGLIYVIVPNRPVHWREVWRGTAVAAALLVVYEVIFPIYEGLFLKPNNYGSIAGFAIVILTFFYYLAVILLLGAEINSWASGQRQTAGDIDAIIHEVQAHNTTRGAAGPTAGSVAEDIQSGKGQAAMSTPARAVAHERVDHENSAQPPKYAEVGEGGHGPAKARPQTPASQRETTHVEREIEHGKHPQPGSLPPAPVGASASVSTSAGRSVEENDAIYSDSDDDDDQSGGTTANAPRTAPRSAAHGTSVGYRTTNREASPDTHRMLNLKLLTAAGAWVWERYRGRRRATV